MKKQLLCLSMFMMIPWASGCDNGGYPADLTYPLRDDPLVIKAPKVQNLPHPILPGELEETIASLSGDGVETLDPGELSADQRGELATALEAVFGSPASPKVAVSEESSDAAAVAEATEKLKLGEEELVSGSKLYRRHCLHCHGLTGDGRGPTGPWVSPHPRDYRQGLFKFISTGGSGSGRKPRRADLLRTLRQGVNDTSMPSFELLEEKELEHLVSYVIHLSVRGEVEFNTLNSLLRGNPPETGSIASDVEMWTGVVTSRWAQAEDEPPLTPQKPPSFDFDRPDSPEYQAAVAEGFKHFREGGACIGCHIDFGRQVGYMYDQWGTLVRPMNLTRGVYRGGNRPIDIYWRIKNGIDPSGMPAPAITEDEKIWTIVAFVKALPHPDLLPEEVRNQIYGNGILTAKAAE